MEASERASRLFDLSGRTALITGGSSGIGHAIARAFVEQGADVAITYLPRFDEDAGMPEAAADFVSFARLAGRQAAAIVADLEDEAAPDSIVAATREALGRIDILVINASYQCGQPMMALDLAAMDREYRINLRSTMRLLQLVVPRMAEAGWGRVLSIGSVLQKRPSDRLISYSALKGAQEVVMQQLAVEYGPRGVLVNTLAPGVVATERNRHFRENVPNWVEQARMGNRLRLLSEPQDYVGAALLLCSEAGRFITGATLFNTGGAHLPYLER